MSIKVSNLTKIYGKQKALDNVSFEISTGEVVGLLGPNGAGKSTMMKIITCFIPQSFGEVSVCGYDTLEQAIEIRKKIGYLPENNPLYFDMYVREYLEFIAGIHKIKERKRERINRIIDITGLETEQNKKIENLSKGFRQRLGIAQALIHNPDVLILDEPTSGLDPNQLLEIRNLIKKIGKEKTVLLCTHIMQEAESVCNRIIIINNGKVVADDSTKNLLKTSFGKEIIIVEFNSKVSAQLLKNIANVKSVKNVKDNIWELQSFTDKDIRSDIFQFAVKHDITVLSMQKKEYNLEKVFQGLTKF
jgi:ABC-2 type transport system ATP-binding protein